jgi:uncharacterized protein
MQASMFNLRVPLPERDEVFLMNTLTDAQLVVSSDVAGLLDSPESFNGWAEGDPGVGEALSVLRENGFLVEDRSADRRRLDDYLTAVKSDTTELNITLLTTLQCNFACDYCFQGDHGDYNKFAEKMSLETAARVGEWIEGELERLRPEKFLLTFFGGEPLLNLPVMYELSERLWHASNRLGTPVSISIITNGLLLTEEVVDRMLPFGLRGVKITLDGDRATHDRMRPLRGGQGTFDRIIENIRKVSGRCGIAIGGNFDESSVDSYPALLEFLREQEFAEHLVKVNFKPIVRNPEPATAKGVLPLIPVKADGTPIKPLGGTCMTSRRGGIGLRHLPHADEDDVSARRNAAHGFCAGRGAQRPCHVHETRAHHRTRRFAVCVPRLYRRERAVDRPHRRPPRDVARNGAREVRTAASLERVRGLCLHPRLCRGMPGCITDTAW